MGVFIKEISVAKITQFIAILAVVIPDLIRNLAHGMK